MVELRFYAELNHFLAPARRGRSFVQATAVHESLKHTIESLGVPHTEVGLALLNGREVGLEHRPLQDGDRVAVFPVFRTLVPALQRPHAGDPPQPLRFIADAHLGRLARYLRFAGYDTLYRATGSDTDLVATASTEGRIVLTRDRDLLMHREVQRGCYLYETEPLAQFRELRERLHLDVGRQRASRCLLCNAVLEPVSKEAVAERVPPRTRQCFEEFWCCPGCGRVFWHGSHWERMRREVLGLSSQKAGPSC